MDTVMFIFTNSLLRHIICYKISPKSDCQFPRYQDSASQRPVWRGTAAAEPRPARAPLSREPQPPQRRNHYNFKNEVFCLSLSKGLFDCEKHFLVTCS